MSNDKQVYTVEEVAVILGVSRNTAYEGIHNNLIPHLKLGRRIIIPAQALNKLLSGPDSPSTSIPEVPLEKAPLKKVLIQVTFPQVSELLSDQGIVPIQKALKDFYPVVRRDNSMPFITLNGQNITQSNMPLVWKLSDVSQSWTITLTSTFVALESTRYESREDLIKRFSHILEKLISCVEIPIYDRIGLRYLNYILEPSFVDDPSPYVNKDLGAKLFDDLPKGITLEHSLSEAVFELPVGTLRSRWGLLAADYGIDPLIPISDKKSWILDLDVFSTEPGTFDTSEIAEHCTQFATHAYGFFRWVVTDEFLKRFKGEGLDE